MNMREYQTQVYEEMCREARAPALDLEINVPFYLEQITRHYHFSKFLPHAQYIDILTHHWYSRVQFNFEDSVSDDKVTLSDIYRFISSSY
jgi:hypothetical protein